MLVVDTNVLAYLVIEGDRTADAEALLRFDAEWAAPRLWRSELRNVLALYVRRSAFDVGDAVRRFEAAAALVEGREYEVPARRVLETAAAGSCSAYDAEFVALAEDLGVRLVTADGPLLRAFPGVAFPLERVSS